MKRLPLHFAHYLACLVPLMSLLTGELAAQAPQGRILNTFIGELRNHEPFLETETMIVSAKTHYRVVQGRGAEEWLKVIFWDKDGGNRSERVIPPGYGAGRSMKCRAQGNDLFFASGGHYYAVNRDPSIPIMSLNGMEHSLCEITDRYMIVRTLHAQDWDGIKFHDRRTFAHIGRVATTLRVEELRSRESDIVFTSRDAKGQFRIHRMKHPDFSKRAVVNMKITAMPGVYGSVNFFGEHHAIVTDLKGDRSILRYSDPAKRGKPGLYALKPVSPFGEWFECGGTLAYWVPYPATELFHVSFSGRDASFDPVGLPAGLLGSRFLSAGEDSFYITSPTSYRRLYKRGKWVQRLDFTPGRSLVLQQAVADERDGILRFTGSLDQPAPHAVTFTYSTVGGSAVADEDFTPVSGVATIPAGQTSTNVDVPLIEDFTIERPESLQLVIGAVQGAFCDSPRVHGRIRGSGARLVEEVEEDVGGFVVGALDDTQSGENMVQSFSIGNHPVEARPLGFEGFLPVADAGDGFRYANAIPLGSDSMKICQFDGTSGELLEVFDHAPFLATGGELVIGKGRGFVRYAFYNGLPVISLEGVAPGEGGGEQVFTVRSERTRRDLGFSAAWIDPERAGGEISFAREASGDVSFRITPLDDRQAGSGLPLGIAVTTTDAGGMVEVTTLTGVSIADDDVMGTRFVPAETFRTLSLAASGNRVWLGRTLGSIVESFDFKGGSLVPGPKVEVPKGVRVISNNYYHSGAGQALAFDGSRLWVSADKATGHGLLVFSGAGGDTPSGAFLGTQARITSQLTLPGFAVSSNTVPVAGFNSLIQVRDPGSKVVAEIKPDGSQGSSFGYSMAAAGNILWISSPRSGGTGGRVDGYHVGTFAPFATLVSPEPVAGGVFGYSIAAHGPHLVVGEPSNSSPGAVWVFSADGSTMRGRLDSGEVGVDGFGCQVATRSGRILVGAGRVESGFGSPAPPPPAHRPVFLWNDFAKNPVRLLPSTADRPDFETGFRIALLDGCALVSAGSASVGGLEYLAFPAQSSSFVAPSSVKSAIRAAWPAEAAPGPRWSFVRIPGGRIEVTVDLGGIPARPDTLILESSEDLATWEPLASASGEVLRPERVFSLTTGTGSMKLLTSIAADGRSFFRLRQAAYVEGQ